MNWICPICNGFGSLTISCPSCGAALLDRGRISDDLGDYSPYRPIDDLKKTNGYTDIANHACLHNYKCSHCHQLFLVPVSELPDADVYASQFMQKKNQMCTGD